MRLLSLGVAATILIASAHSSEAAPADAVIKRGVGWAIGAVVGGVAGNRADAALFPDPPPHGKFCKISDGVYDMPTPHPVGTQCWVDFLGTGIKFYGKVVQ